MLFQAAQISARLGAIERKLDLIIEQLGIAPNVSSPEFEEVRSLALSGDKIAAIKAYREKTRVGLAEAKAFVDAIR